MKVVAYYKNETRIGLFDNKVISLFFEIGNSAQRLTRQEYCDIRNMYVSTMGPILEVLLPINDAFATLNKIEIYEGDVLIKSIVDPKRPTYRIYIPTNREPGVDLLNPMLIETFLFDLY